MESNIRHTFQASSLQEVPTHPRTPRKKGRKTFFFNSSIHLFKEHQVTSGRALEGQDKQLHDFGALQAAARAFQHC